MSDGSTPAGDGGSGAEVVPAKKAAAPAAPERRQLSRLFIVGVITFVVGLVAGGIVVGLAGIGSSGSGSSSSASGSSSSPSPSPSQSSAAASVSVNSACLRAVNDAQAVAQALSGLSSAVKGLDAGALDQIVRQENILQMRLQQEIKDCKATVRLPDGSLSPTPVVTASP